MNFHFAFAICSGYEEDAVEVFEPFLKALPQMTYENMQNAFDVSRNISENAIYRRAMEKKPLRSLIFQVTAIIWNWNSSVCTFRADCYWSVRSRFGTLHFPDRRYLYTYIFLSVKTSARHLKHWKHHFSRDPLTRSVNRLPNTYSYIPHGAPYDVILQESNRNR